MPDVIKDVVVRIALQQIKAQLEAPDVSPIIQAEKKITETVKKEAAERTEAAKKQYEEGARSSINFADIAAKESLAAETRLEDARQQLAGKRMGGELAEKMKSAEDEAIKSVTEKVESQREAWGKLAESALKYGRAAVLANGAAGGELDKTLENLMKIQAGMDLLKASQGIIKNIGTAFGASEVAVASFTARLGAVGAVLALIAAASLGANKLGNALFDNEANELLDKEAARTKELEKRMKSIQAGKGDPGERHAMFQSKQERFDDAARKSGLGEELKKNQDFAEATFKKRFDFEIEQSHRSSEAREAALGREMTAQEKLKDLERQRAETNRIAGKFRNELGATEESRAAALATTYAEILRIDRDRVSALKQQGSELKSNIDKQYDAIKAATATLDTEQEKVDSLKQKFGELTDLEQEEAKQIAERIKNGTASQADTKRLGELGLGELAEDARRKQGLARAGGFDSVYKNATGKNLNTDVEVAQSQLDNAEDGGASPDGRNIQQKERDLEKNLDESRKAFKELGAAISEFADYTREEAEKTIRKLRANQNAAGG